MYLLPAGQAPRSNTKLGHLRSRRGLGAVVSRLMMSNGGGPTSDVILYRPPVLPGPMPVWPGAGGSVGIRPVPIVNPVWPGGNPIPLPVVSNPIPPVPPTLVCSGSNCPNTGTPVPIGFPTNQFFVSSDGSVWQFGNGKWFNTGTPNTAGGSGAPPALPAAAPIAAGGDTSAPVAPVSVTVAPAGESSYQAILDWLTQSTLISPVPNWIVGGGVALVAWKLFGSGKKR